MRTEAGVRAGKARAGRGVWTSPRALAVAAVAAALICFTGVFDHSAWTPDEPRDAEVGREMALSGDYVVPTLARKPFLEKPPIGWWPMAGLYSVFGVSDGVARTSSALAGLLTLLLVFDVVRRIADPFAALMAALATGTLSGFFFECHRIVVDPWLSLFVMLGYWGYVAAMYPRAGPEHGDSLAFPPSRSPGFRPCPWAIGVIYLAGGLSFLVKGPVGPGLIVGPIIAFIVAGRRWNFFRSWMHLPGALVFLAMCCWWPWALYRRGGTGLMDGFLIGSLYDRLFPPAHGPVMTGHKEAAWYYLANFPSAIFPWLVAVPAMCHWLWRKRVPRGWDRSALVFLAWVFPIGLVTLSAAGTKRGLYLLPLVAPFGAVMGAWIASVVKDEQPHRIDWWTLSVLLGLLILASAAAVAVPALIRLAPGLAGPGAKWLRIHRVPEASALLFQLVGGIFLLVSFYGISLLRRGRARVAALIAWMTFGLLAAGTPMLYSYLDEFKSLHPFTADLVKLRAFSPELAAYKPDETTLAVVPYDTGHYLQAFDDIADLEAYLARNPSDKLLALKKERREVLPEGLRPLLRLAQSWEISGHRVYELYDVRAPQAAELEKR